MNSNTAVDELVVKSGVQLRRSGEACTVNRIAGCPLKRTRPERCADRFSAASEEDVTRE